MAKTMITTIDAAGRLVVPKEIREQANLGPDTPLRIRFTDGRIEIEPEPRAVRILRKGRLAVAVPLEEGESLGREAVDRVIRDHRVRRKGS
jgi:AbrB family looped-hinge helix DNA binding protein